MVNFGLHAVAVVWTDPVLSNCPPSIQSSGRPSVVRGYISKLLWRPEGGYDICLSVINLTLHLRGHFLFTLYQTHVCVCVCVCGPHSPSLCVSKADCNDVCRTCWSVSLSSCQCGEVNSVDTVGSQESRKCDQKLLLQSRSDTLELCFKEFIVFSLTAASIKSSRSRHQTEPELSVPLVLYSWTSWGVSTGSF